MIIWVSRVYKNGQMDEHDIAGVFFVIYICHGYIRTVVL